MPMPSTLRLRRYILAYACAVLVFAALYCALFAIAFGMELSCALVDGAAFGVTFGIQGVLVWGILRYATPQGGGAVRDITILCTGVITVIFSVGIEALVAYLHCEAGFLLFVESIPVRILTVSMAYAILTISYLKERPTTAVEELQLPIEPISKPEVEPLNRITVKSGQKIKIITPDEIEYMQAEGDYVAIITHEGRWLKEQTMKYFEENLPCDGFVRIHRSYIVGIHNIVRIERYGKLYQVALKNGEKIRVSPNGYKLLKERMRL